VVLALLLLAGASPPAAAELLKLEGHFTQGGLLFGRTAAGTAVLLDGERIPVAPDGRFLVGFGRDAAPTAALELRFPDGTQETKTLAIASRTYGEQKIEGLPQATVTPDPALQARIDRENAAVARARLAHAAVAYWAGGFAWPCRGPISGVYGTARVLNGEPRQPHYGVDIAAPEGTLVAAPADGIVTLAARDMVLTGGTIVIDHGQGLSSTLMHLSAVLVPVGRFVEQGAIIGRIGHTGRATGPHLDWRMNWRGARIDAELLVPPMPASGTSNAPAAAGAGASPAASAGD
jgi:murein DD-endopeptidase MepM/ murein hydrolase activator NlpD